MRRIFAVLAVLAATVEPLAAAKLYVPVATNEPFAGRVYKTRLWVSNPTDATSELRLRFISAGTDGRQGALGGPIRVAPRSSVLVDGLVPNGQSGAIEIEADAGLFFYSELTPVIGKQRRSAARVPVVSADNLVPGGELSQLQGLVRDTGVGTVTNVGILSLSDTENDCSAAVFRSNGDPVGGTVGFTLPPLGNLEFDRALALIGLGSVDGIRVDFTCERDYYPYATIFGGDPEETLFIGPSQSSDDGIGSGSTTQPPPPPRASGSFCRPRSDGGVSCAIDGDIFSPNHDHGPIFVVDDPEDLAAGHAPSSTVVANLEVGSGTFGRFVMEAEVSVGPWSYEPSKNHSLMEIRRGRCCSPWPTWGDNVFGFINHFGPGSGRIVRAFTNAGIGGDRQKMDQRYPMESGETYRLRYTYDRSKRRRTLDVFHAGRLVSSKSDHRAFSSIRSRDGYFMVAFGHPDEGNSGNARPTRGWVYSDLSVEFIP